MHKTMTRYFYFKQNSIAVITIAVVLGCHPVPTHVFLVFPSGSRSNEEHKNLAPKRENEKRTIYVLKLNDTEILARKGLITVREYSNLSFLCRS